MHKLAQTKLPAYYVRDRFYVKSESILLVLNIGCTYKLYNNTFSHVQYICENVK